MCGNRAGSLRLIAPEPTKSLLSGAKAKGRLIRVRLDVLHEDPTQMRQTYDEEYIRNLSENIKEMGIRNPPEVEEVVPRKRYIISAGHCRVRACRLAGLKEITVRAHRNMTREKFIAIQIAENIHQSVRPDEAAEKFYSFYVLLDEKFGKVSMAKFARYVGKSESVVRDAFRFVKLDTRVKKYIHDGVLPYGTGVLLAEVEGGDAQNDLAIHSILSHSKVLVKDIKRAIEGYRMSRSQRSLEDIFYGDQAEAERQRLLNMKFHIDTVAHKEMLQALGYWRNILYLHEKNEGTAFDPLRNKTIRQRFGELEALVGFLRMTLDAMKANGLGDLRTELAGEVSLPSITAHTATAARPAFV